MTLCLQGRLEDQKILSYPTNGEVLKVARY